MNPIFQSIYDYIQVELAHMYPNWFLEPTVINSGISFIIHTPEGLGSGNVLFSTIKQKFSMKISQKGNNHAAFVISTLVSEAISKGIPFKETINEFMKQINKLDNPLRNILLSIKTSLEKQGFYICKSKAIPYGFQVFFSKENEVYRINTYHTKNRGLSIQYLPGNNKKNQEIFKSVITAAIPNEAQNEWKVPYACYLGIDEAGKGDYFGPLVVAGFIYNEDYRNRLIDMGIKDSKLLIDKQIIEISSILMKEFLEKCIIKVFLPSTYNKLYEKFSASGKNLNDLLAWAHSKVLEDALKKSTLEAVLSDQFTDEKTISKALRKISSRIEIRIRTKGEDNLAVAAASILARARFLIECEKLGENLGRKIPLGSSSETVQIAKEINLQKGREILSSLVKLHFKITEKIL